MSIANLILSIPYLILPLFIVFYIRAYYIQDKEEKYFFLTGYLLKLFGAIFSYLVYTEYYQGGDMTSYYLTGKLLAEYVSKYPSEFFTILSANTTNEILDMNFYSYKQVLGYGRNSTTFTVSKISMILNFITLDSYFLTVSLCSVFSFFCSWKFYKFIKRYSNYHTKQIGYAVFFIPSVFFWGSGLFKDTFTLGAFYLLLISLINLLLYSRLTIANILYLIVSYYLLVNIRSFYLVLILPVVFYWVFSSRYSRIKNWSTRVTFLPILLLVISGAIFISLNFISQSFAELSIDNLQSRAKGFQQWHTYQKGSAYSLGTIEYSLSGLANKFIPSVNVTFFRPYIWEANKPIIFLSFIQSFVFTLLTIYFFLKIRIFSFFSLLVKSIEGSALFYFSIIFSAIVGFTSYNFGALDRYKIPCLSTYLVSLILLYDTYQQSKEVE